MKCPFCHHEESKVTDSRNHLEGAAIKRRRECLSCARRFTTLETIDLVVQVKKRDNTYEDFQQEKLIAGLNAACCHTRINHDDIRKMVNDITKELLERQLRVIASQDLGKIVMAHLQKQDVIAYIRFACVYQRFKDIDELRAAIRIIENYREQG